MISALHEVRDTEKFEALQASMEREGWQGRPLIVIEVSNWYQAITGSHRLAAAEKAGLEEIPCVVITSAALDEAELTVNDFWDDDITLSLLQVIGAGDAIALMEQEIAANQ